MSDNRKRLSGASYRRKAAEKKERQETTLKTIPKLESFFRMPSIPAIPVNDNDTDDIHPDPAMGSNEESAASNKDINPSDTGCSPINVVESGEMETPTTATEPTPISNDPADWILNEATREYVVRNGLEQNKDEDFSKTKRQYPDTSRMLSKQAFTRKMVNGEIRERTWLVYSVSKEAVFCGPCRLFNGNSTALAQDGFRDWKNAHQRLSKHEHSNEHRTCVTSFKVRSEVLGLVDTRLALQMEDEIGYWRNVLKRVVAVVKALAARGLPFRGHDELFGSLHNGNYMMALELIAEFDPFLGIHISKQGNPGSGMTSYLSSTTCEQFICLISEKITKTIIQQVKSAKYFSIILDSSPDISHTDQLSFVLRYVNAEGSPVERFLTFISNTGHKSSQLAEVTMTTLLCHDLDIANCRGQSYDNASNMSGAYTGLQARIKNENPLVDYIPCAGHSLNLVGASTAESCPEVVSFFGILQEVYNFFSASNHRWMTLLQHMKHGSKTVKSLSKTRWSARDDACQSLSSSWIEILQALESIEDDPNEKPVSRHEAAVILRQLNRLETAFMVVLWSFLLGRFNSTSKKLQSVSIDVSMVMELYGSLIQLVRDTRDCFEEYEQKAKLLSTLETYEHDTRRAKKRKVPFDESREGEINLSGRDNFRINTFHVIMDKLICELEKRRSAYQVFFDRFQVLTKISLMSFSEVAENAQKLQQYYSCDLEESFAEECLHFRAHLLSMGETSQTPLQMGKMMRDKELHNLYPNVDIALRMFVCTPATNCSAERSFSCLKRVKNYLRSRMTDGRLNSLAIMTIESDLLTLLNYDDVIDAFAIQNSRRKAL